MKAQTGGHRKNSSEAHGRLLMQLIHTVTAQNARRATMDLSIRERLVVQRLGIEGDLTINTLGQRLGVTPSSMTGLIDRLEAGGYLRRIPHPSDRRATVLNLSRKGRAAFEREVAYYGALLDQTLGSLGSEAHELVLNALMTLAPVAEKDAA